VTGESKYYTALAQYVEKVMRIKKTPKGLVFVQKWAPNRHAANVAFIAAQAAALKPALPKAGDYFRFAKNNSITCLEILDVHSLSGSDEIRQRNLITGRLINHNK